MVFLLFHLLIQNLSYLIRQKRRTNLKSTNVHHGQIEYHFRQFYPLQHLSGLRQPLSEYRPQSKLRLQQPLPHPPGLSDLILVRHFVCTLSKLKIRDRLNRLLANLNHRFK